MREIILELLSRVERCLPTAICVTEVFSRYVSEPVRIDFIERISGLGLHEAAHIPVVLDALEKSGFCRRCGEDVWSTSGDPTAYESLLLILRGANWYRQVHKDRDEVQVVLTRPELPSDLMEALPHQGPYFVKLGDTDSALIRIAQEAKDRFVIVTPFIDKAGAERIAQLFQINRSKTVERVLIIRDYDAIKEPLSGVFGILDEMDVRIYDYFVKHNNRRPPYETFHAKFVLGDNLQAYIGSANMMSSSFEVVLEVGVLLKGKSVLDIKRLVNSMIEISNPIL